MGFKYIPATIGLVGTLTLFPLYSSTNEGNKGNGELEDSVIESFPKGVLKAGDLTKMYIDNPGSKFSSKKISNYEVFSIKGPIPFRDYLFLEMSIGERSKIGLGLVGKLKLGKKSYGVPVGARLRKTFYNGSEISLEARPTIDGVSNPGVIIGGKIRFNNYKDLNPFKD